MASRRRRNNPSASPDPHQSQSPNPDHSFANTSELDAQIPFYNTTFSAHRVSPLYIGKEELTPKRLEVLAHRLRDTLVGDVVRGVEVGMEGDFLGLGRAGALEAVEVQWVGLRGVLDLGREGENEEEEGEWAGKSALYIGLRYGAAGCTALLLPGLGRGDNTEEGRGKFWVGEMGGDTTGADSAQFLSMPLLLLRMPAPLKAVIAEFLATEFDCRVSQLRLGTRSMVRSWEGWIRSAGLPTRGALAKDVVVTLGFYIPPPQGKSDGEAGEDDVGNEQLGLKSIDVFIPAAELRKFVDAGADAGRTKRKAAGSTWEDNLAKRRKLAGRLHEEGWEWRLAETNVEGDPLAEQHFTEALGRYVDKHLGLNLFHPGVRITKIACGGFVMSEARVKVFAPADFEGASGSSSSSGQRGAILELMQGLVKKAAGGVGK